MINIGKKKEKSKDQKSEKNSIYYSWKGVAIAVGIVILIGLLNSIYPEKAYDPSIHKCLSWTYLCESEKCLVEDIATGERVVLSNKFWKKSHFDSENGYTVYNNAKGYSYCEKYEPKSFCELCIDDWTEECEKECQCTEWDDSGTCPDGYEAYEYSEHCGVCVNSSWYNSDKFNRSDIYFCNPSPCISAREKTECEKGNPDWIFAKEKTEIESPDGKKHLLDGCYPICRKKTIYDYSCQFLKEKIFIEVGYCPSKEKWWDEDIHFCKDSLSITDIKEAYLIKGCEIA